MPNKKLVKILDIIFDHRLTWEKQTYLNFKQKLILYNKNISIYIIGWKIENIN